MATKIKIDTCAFNGGFPKVPKGQSVKVDENGYLVVISDTASKPRKCIPTPQANARKPAVKAKKSTKSQEKIDLDYTTECPKVQASILKMDRCPVIPDGRGNPYITFYKWQCALLSDGTNRKINCLVNGKSVPCDNAGELAKNYITPLWHMLSKECKDKFSTWCQQRDSKLVIKKKAKAVTSTIIY